MKTFIAGGQGSGISSFGKPVEGKAERQRLNRRDVVLASAAIGAGLAALPAKSMAQARSIKEQLIGVWSLTDIFDETTDGIHHASWGPGVQGLTIYTSSGQFSAQVMAANRDKAASKDPRQPVGLSIAYFGTYSVDEAAMTLALRIERCSFPAWDGIERVSKIAILTEDQLGTVAATAHLPDLGDIHPNQHYKRVG
jgi:Lipocalin-like domain